MQLGKIEKKFEISILLMWNLVDLVALLEEVLAIGFPEGGVVLDDANARRQFVRGRCAGRSV